MIRSARLLAVITALLALAGCAADTGIRGYWTLHDTDFRKLKPGMTKPDVVAIVGKPRLAVTFARLGEEVWEYRYLDGQIFMKAHVSFDTKGVFKGHVESYDQDAYDAVSE
ncbi:MAG: outer membrane protein assembly factor BamE [Betaproteobacteria bacterium]|nr:outer membrane protein assembly factor BamE [Betaproteobacteria bacterium]